MSLTELLTDLNNTIGKISRHLQGTKKSVFKGNKGSFESEFICHSNSGYEAILLYQQFYVQFFQIGCYATENNLLLEGSFSINSNTRMLLKSVVSSLLQIKNWLLDRFNLFKSFKPYYSEEERSIYYDLNLVFMVRSGIQYFIDIFKGMNNELDKCLEEISLLARNIYDEEITELINSNMYILEDSYKNLAIPKSHKWWL